MPVVSNTSPILNLALIGNLNLLQKQFGEVIIPAEVLAELFPEGETRGVATIQQAVEAGWLRVAAASTAQVARVLALELDRGEAAAIALAMDMGIVTVLMDERDGRQKAKALGLTPLGVLGILLRAKHDGELASVASAVQALRDEAGFFVTDDLVAEILVEAGEPPRE